MDLLVFVVLDLCLSNIVLSLPDKATSKTRKTKKFVEPSIYKKVINSSTFIDRTLLVEELFNHGNLFIGAPRGYGKSTNLDMFKLFLEFHLDERGEPVKEIKTNPNYDLFVKRNLNIVKNRTLFNQNFGKYPVLYLDYSELNGITNYESMMVALRKILRSAYARFKFLTKIPEIWYSEGETEVFSKFVSVMRSIHLDHYDIRFGFDWLSEILNRHFRVKIIILIDEYDSYIQHVVNKKNPNEDKILSFIRSINKDLLLDNEYLERAVLTGETVDYATLSSTLRYVKVYNVLYDDSFSKYYGVTDAEQEEMLRKYVKDKTKKEKAIRYCEEERVKLETLYREDKLWSLYGYKTERPINRLYSFRPILYCGRKIRNIV